MMTNFWPENLPLWSIELYKKLSFFFLTFAGTPFAPNYFTSKMWEKVRHQKLHSTLGKQKIDPWWNVYTCCIAFCVHCPTVYVEKGPFFIFLYQSISEHLHRINSRTDLTLICGSGGMCYLTKSLLS
jgi:hypothetical protein